MVPITLGSDTEDPFVSLRHFAVWLGLSLRMGVFLDMGWAFASSLDQIGPFSQCIEDAAILDVISGFDPKFNIRASICSIFFI